jgi:hypothetical protein
VTLDSPCGSEPSPRRAMYLISLDTSCYNLPKI